MSVPTKKHMSDRLYNAVKANAKKQAKKLIPKAIRKAFKKARQQTVGHLEKTLDTILPGKTSINQTNLLEMPKTNKNKPKASTKGKRKQRKPKSKKGRKLSPFIKSKKGGTVRIRSNRPSVGFLGVRPRYSTTRGNKLTTRGLTMKGGTVSGVTEISSNLQLQSGQNVAGQVIALVPLHPQLIAPGTRLADIAAMYDQYVFSSVQFELDPTLPYAVGGRLLGFVERDATDPIGAQGTAVGNVAEWMDHGSAIDHPIQGGSGQARLIFPRKGRYMYQIGKGPVGGYYLNKLAVSGSSTSTDINNCYQGQFCLMLHTTLNTEGGQALQFPIPLGPLRVRWTLKFREAAERNQGQSGGDKHLTTTGGSLSNPMNWTNTLTKQISMLSWSSIGIQTRQLGSTTTIRGASFANGYLTANFPVGFYQIMLDVNYVTSGAANYQWIAGPQVGNIGNQTGVVWIDYNSTLPQLSVTPGNGISQTCWAQFEVITPGELVIAGATGSSSGWVIDSYAVFEIFSLPGSATSLLKHPNLLMRSLAFQNHVAKSGSGKAMADLIRQELGLPPKEEKDGRLELAWMRILQDEQRQDERNATAHIPREPKGRDEWDTPEEDPDDWDEPQTLHFDFSKCRTKISESDEKKGPGTSRPSSLKSSGGKDKERL